MLIFVFVLILLLCFVVVFFFSRSNETQLAVRRRLATLQESPRFKQTESGSILKQERLSPSDSVHDLLAKFPISFRLFDLIRQAGPEWWVSSVLFYSALLAFAGMLIGLTQFNSIVMILLTAALT